MKTKQIPGSQQRHQRSHSRRRGFTLVQIVIVLGIISILAATSMTVFRRGRTTARRAQCDVNIKEIAIALDAYRQENGQYPKDLNELVTKGYIKDKNVLHCPSDPRPTGTYNDFYIPRAPRNEIQGRLTNPPIVVCPFHEQDSNTGVQAFTGVQTNQFATQPAILQSPYKTSIQRPGEVAIAATEGLKLHGGDRITTQAGGSAIIAFVDGTTCNIQSKSDITVLQSFRAGTTSNSLLYSMVHQASGSVTYTVHHGSNFDVVTPAATAGALGTKFTITVDGTSGKTGLYVIEGHVYLVNQTLHGPVLAPVGQWLNDVVNDVLTLPVIPLLGGLLGGLLG